MGEKNPHSLDMADDPVDRLHFATQGMTLFCGVYARNHPEGWWWLEGRMDWMPRQRERPLGWVGINELRLKI